MKQITADTKNSDIIINHADYGLTKEEAMDLVIARHMEYARNNQPGSFGKAPKGGWTDADRVPAR